MKSNREHVREKNIQITLPNIDIDEIKDAIPDDINKQYSRHTVLNTNYNKIFSFINEQTQKNKNLQKEYAYLNECMTIITSFTSSICTNEHCSSKINRQQCYNCGVTNLFINEFVNGLYEFDDNFFYRLSSSIDVYVVSSNSIPSYFRSIPKKEDKEDKEDKKNKKEERIFFSNSLLKSIFSIIKSNKNYTIPSSAITYGLMIDSIHFNIIYRLVDKKSLYYEAGGIKSPYYKLLIETHLNYANTFFPRSFFAPYAAASFLANMKKAAINDIQIEYHSDKSSINLFHNLHIALSIICNNSTSALDDLSILLAKIYAGRTYIDHTPYKNHSTLIAVNNTEYIYSFLKDILTITYQNKHFSPPNYICPSGSEFDNQVSIYDLTNSVHITSFTCSGLCNDQNISSHIHNKLLGNIVNLDCASQHCNISIMEKIITGKKVTASDEIFGELKYISNAHYVFIRKDFDDNVASKLLPYSDQIDLTQSKIECLYKPLKFYEKLFMVTTFVEHGLDLLASTISTQKKFPPEHYLELFYEKYISFTGNEKDYIYKQKGKTSSSNELYDNFLLFLKGFRYNEKITLNDFSAFLKSRGVESGRAKGADPRASFFKIKFKKEIFDADMNEINSNKNTSTNASTSFNNYLAQLLQQYVDDLDNYLE